MLLKIIDTVVLAFTFNAVVVNSYSGNSLISQTNGENRQPRLLGLITDPALNLYFEYNSCYALAAVVSVPLELPSSRNVSFSYNFETNYYYSYFDHQQGLTPLQFSYITEPGTDNGIFNRTYLPPVYRQFSDNAKVVQSAAEQNKTEEMSDDNKLTNKSISNENVELNSEIKEDKNSTTKTKQKQSKAEKAKIRKIRTILQNYYMSRRRFYKMVESKMDSSGMIGSVCLLKAICETSADSFKLHNGVIGSVVDILFLPSASKDEKLSKRYYQAEANGKLRNCSVYDRGCPKSLFDFITKII